MFVVIVKLFILTIVIVIVLVLLVLAIVILVFVIWFLSHYFLVVQCGLTFPSKRCQLTSIFDLCFP